MNPVTTGPAPRARLGTPLPEDLRNALAAMVREHGDREAAKRVQVSTNTIQRALAGLGVNRGTVALIRAAVGNTP